MIIRKGDIGAVMRIERYLEKVEQIAIRVAKSAASRNRSRVDTVVADSRLRELGIPAVPVDAFGHVHIPLRPAAVCPIGTGFFHSSRVIGTSRKVGAEPGNDYVPIGVRCHPWEHIRLSHSCALIHPDWI